MSNRMQIILGSQRFLKTFFAAHDDPMLLLKPMHKDQNYALIDINGTVPFAVPMRYWVRAQSTPLADHGFIQIQYFHLPEDVGPVFIAKAKTLIEHAGQLKGNLSLSVLEKDAKDRDYVLLSQWERTLDVFASKSTPSMLPISEFAKRAAQGQGYHDATYQIVSPDADPDADDDNDAAKADATL